MYINVYNINVVKEQINEISDKTTHQMGGATKVVVWAKTPSRGHPRQQSFPPSSQRRGTVP
jgi:hypothetical protein